MARYPCGRRGEYQPRTRPQHSMVGMRQARITIAGSLRENGLWSGVAAKLPWPLRSSTTMRNHQPSAERQRPAGAAENDCRDADHEAGDCGRHRSEKIAHRHGVTSPSKVSPAAPGRSGPGNIPERQIPIPATNGDEDQPRERGPSTTNTSTTAMSRPMRAAGLGLAGIVALTWRSPSKPRRIRFLGIGPFAGARAAAESRRGLRCRSRD